MTLPPGIYHGEAAHDYLAGRMDILESMIMAQIWLTALGGGIVIGLLIAILNK